MIEYDSGEDNNEISVLADYYLNRATGLRGGIAVNSGDACGAEGTRSHWGIDVSIQNVFDNV